MTDLLKTRFEDLVSEFRELDDRDAELELLLELGGSLPPFPEAKRTEENKVHGCLSQAWVVPSLTEEAPHTLRLEADSDSQIVAGLIAVLIVLFNGRTPTEAATLDARGALKEIGLERHLSPQRRNGLYGMLRRVQAFAKAFA
ncbi:MAG: SufE family protein [Planctomycetota bacterium]|nr:SufE family protein [Planctomycetota bacterium]